MRFCTNLSISVVYLLVACGTFYYAYVPFRFSLSLLNFIFDKNCHSLPSKSPKYDEIRHEYEFSDQCNYHFLEVGFIRLNYVQSKFLIW